MGNLLPPPPAPFVRLPHTAGAPRLIVLDTDIGWDPDDILAVATLLKLVKSSDRVVLLSSAESLGGDRARVLRRIAEACPSAASHVLVARGSESPAVHNPLALCLPVMIASDLLQPPDPSHPIPGLSKVAELIATARREQAHVLWIGIGALSNLCALLSGPSTSWPDTIVQQGGRILQAGFNFRLDPSAAVTAVRLAQAAAIPLTFVTSETTGQHPAMLWVEDRYAADGTPRTPAERMHPTCAGRGPWDHHAPLPDYWSLLSALPRVRDALVDNMAPPGGYLHSSALHDPLTVVHAMTAVSTADSDGCAVASSVLAVVPARLIMDQDARWVAVHVPPSVWTSTHASLSDATGTDHPRQQWWHGVGARYSQLSQTVDSDVEMRTPNCLVSWGPPTTEQMSEFWSQLRQAFAIPVTHDHDVD
jgi:inosine-uridine nucleoside N-ribohydrolase